MPRDLGDILNQKKELLRDASPWAFLYEVRVPTEPATRLRVTNYRTPLTFGTNSLGNPVQYYPAAVTNSGVTITNEGDLPTVRVTVTNQPLMVDGDVKIPKPTTVLEDHFGLTGQPAVMRVVDTLSLDDLSAQVEVDLQVTRVGCDGQNVTFELGLPALQRMPFPGRRYTGIRCSAIFGSPECGYIIPEFPTDEIGGGFSFCTRTLAACEIRGLDEEARSVPVEHPFRINLYKALVGSI